MAETTSKANPQATNANPQTGFARETKGATTRNLQLGREERQQVGAAGNRKQKNKDFLPGEQSLKWKEQRQKVGEYLQHEGERVYTTEELQNLDARPVANLEFTEDVDKPKMFEAGGQQEAQLAGGQKRRRRRNRGGRGKAAAASEGGLRPSELAPRTKEKEDIQSEMNLEWVPTEPNFKRQKGRRSAKNATPSQPTPAKKASIKGAQQVFGQTGEQSIGLQGGEQQQQQQSQQQSGEGGKRKRQRKRRRGGQQKKEGGGSEQTLDLDAQLEKKKQEWSSQEAIPLNVEKVVEKGKELTGKAGEDIAEKGKDWSEKASSAMGGNKNIKGKKKSSSSSSKKADIIEERKNKDSSTKEATEKMEDYTPIEAVKSLASDVVEQTGNKLGDIKDAALSTLGFDTSSSTEERVEKDQKEVREDINKPEEAEGEGMLEAAKGMISNAYETVKEKAESAIEVVSEVATEIGLTLEPGLAPDTIDEGSKKKEDLSKESRMDNALDKMESVQPI